MTDLQLTLVVVAALGSGLMGGALFAFSSFVMVGLKRLPGRQGMEAMQSINVTAVTPVFMSGLFGTAAACLAVAVVALSGVEQVVARWMLAGAGLYLLGVVVMTATYHVPRNDRLAATDPNDPTATALWARYLREWTRWNHVRTAAAMGASMSFIIATVTA